ncbi:MAG: hypothetical protein AAFU64_01595, partial [Bacteroidota bacterium]
MANVIEKRPDQSYKCYSTGHRLSRKACATLYRIAYLDTNFFYFSGSVKDYYLDGTLAYQANYQ